MGEGLDVGLRVTQHVFPVLDPGVRGELAVHHAHADADGPSVNPSRLEHATERDGAHEAERAKDAERGGSVHREREAAGLIEVPIGVRRERLGTVDRLGEPTLRPRPDEQLRLE